MQKNNLFYTHYDTIFSGKNYRKEIDFCLEVFKKHSQLKLNKILEIGCGTGNHTQLLAERKLEVTAVYVDINMLDISRKKLKK